MYPTVQITRKIVESTVIDRPESDAVTASTMAMLAVQARNTARSFMSAHPPLDCAVDSRSPHEQAAEGDKLHEQKHVEVPLFHDRNNSNACDRVS